jgi:uncharacterized cupin superfamily protein
MTDREPFELATTCAHLGLGATVEPLVDFTWDEEALAAYEASHAGDGADGRLVVLSRSDADWTAWERHPAGEELVFLLEGRMTLLQDRDGTEVRIPMTGGQAVVNPKGVWHTADVHEPGRVLYITPGLGTEHRPR